MPHPENLCQHLNEIIDEKEGSIICTDCGLVLSPLFKTYSNDTFNYAHNNATDDIREILSRLNFPMCFVSTILKNYENKCSTKDTNKKLLTYVVYETLNELGFPSSIKDVSQVTGIEENIIYKMQSNNKSIILQPEDLLEKYCKLLNLDYKTYSLIKKDLPKSNETGHNPLTIVAATIYLYCKNNNIKYSMKQIATTLNISSVSIQRYLKIK